MKYIKKVRISRIHAGKSDEEWLRKRKNIITQLYENGYSVRDGTRDKDICLSGERGVQAHIRKSDAYLFFGQLTIGEMLKACSLIVGTQTLDPDLHFEGPEGRIFVKPTILFGSSSNHGLLAKQLEILKEHGTIRQNLVGPHRILRRPEKIEQLIPELEELIERTASVHGYGTTDVKPAPEEKHMSFGLGTHTLIDKKKPDYNICVFTSARKEQDKVSEAEALLLGELIAKGNYGLITGLGNVGLMLLVHLGSINNGGLSYGANCPHIITLEGMPEGFAEAWVTPDIYERMAVMLKESDAVVVSGGGRGGAGTLQEALAAILLISRNSASMRAKDRKSYKPLIIDNRLDLWQPLIQIAEHYGLVSGKHFHVAKGSQDVMNIINGIRSGKIAPASIS